MDGDGDIYYDMDVDVGIELYRVINYFACVSEFLFHLAKLNSVLVGYVTGENCALSMGERGDCPFIHSSFTHTDTYKRISSSTQFGPFQFTQKLPSLLARSSTISSRRPHHLLNTTNLPFHIQLPILAIIHTNSNMETSCSAAFTGLHAFYYIFNWLNLHFVRS